MKEYHILNLGAGVQSTMLYLLACQQHSVMPKIDCAIFADVGDEPIAVYDHLAWLQSIDGPPIITVSAGCLGDDLMNGSKTSKGGRRFAAIPCFTSGGGMGRRQCTAEYKVKVIEKYIRREIVGLNHRQRFPVNDVHVHQYMGLSFDESRRVIRGRKRFMDIPWGTAHFPLFESNTTRKGAQQWLHGRVPHKVPRSACVYCPFHSNAEWRAVKAVPVDWERACQIDDALRDDKYICNRGMRETQFVHYSRVPLRDADLTTKPQTEEFGFVRECEGMCGV